MKVYNRNETCDFLPVTQAEINSYWLHISHNP